MCSGYAVSVFSEFLYGLLPRFPDVKYFDIGGGLPVNVMCVVCDIMSRRIRHNLNSICHRLKYIWRQSKPNYVKEMSRS